MKSCARIVLQTDQRIKDIPHGQSLIEYVIRSTSDILIEAASISDFCSRIELGIAPFQAQLGPINVELVDHDGCPYQKDDDVMVVSISMNSLTH